MKGNIGLRYNENIRDLARRINEGSIDHRQVRPEGKTTCYFCSNSIEGLTIEIIDQETIGTKEVETTYMLHPHCYGLARFLKHGDPRLN